MNTGNDECDSANARRQSVPGPAGVKLATEALTCGGNKTNNTKTTNQIKQGKLSIVEREMESHDISISHYISRQLREIPCISLVWMILVCMEWVSLCQQIWINKFLGCNPVSECIISIKLNTKPCTLNILQVYASTSASSDEDIENFYGTLKATIDAIRNREVTVILGDWNA